MHAEQAVGQAAPVPLCSLALPHAHQPGLRLGRRLCVAGKGTDAALQIDLKGALYDARLAPCAATLAVINLGPSEAKVELLTSQFLQLDRVNSDEDHRQQFMWDDQDADQARPVSRTRQP